MPRSSCSRRSMRVCRSASWMTALKVLPSALASASAARASSAGREIVFLTAVAMVGGAGRNCDGMNKSYRRLNCLSKARATRARNDRSRRSPCVPRLNRIRPRLQAQQQLLPQAVGFPAQHELRVGLVDVPQAAVELVVELPRPPHHQPEEKARVVGLRLDDAVDRLGVVGEENIRRDADRAVLPAPVLLHQGEDEVAVHGAAEKERIGDFLRGLVLGEKLGQAHLRRLVDDEADVAAALNGFGEHDGGAPDRVLELAFRHEEHRVPGCSGTRGGEKKYRRRSGEGAQKNELQAGHCDPPNPGSSASGRNGLLHANATQLACQRFLRSFWQEITLGTLQAAE